MQYLNYNGMQTYQNYIGSFNEVPHRSNHHITQGDIGFVSNGLEYVFFIRGYADCHDSITSFWHGGRV